MLGLILSFLVAFTIGLLFVELLWPFKRSLQTELLLKTCLAVPLGHGITSCLLFLWLLVFGQVHRAYMAAEIVTLAGLALVLFLRRRMFNTSRPAEDQPAADQSEKVRLRYGWLFPAAFYAAFGSTVVVIILSILREPYGLWDGWAIYGVHARSIFRGGTNWREGFSQLIWWSHPDYPLLLPLSSVRIWIYSGREIAFAQPLVTALFALATAGLICTSLILLRSRIQGYLAGTVVLGFAMFVLFGSSACADVPIMFFITATFVLFALHHESELKDGRYLILAGVTAGLAAWTKNEGLLFVLSAMVAHLIVTVGTHERKAYLRQLSFITLGLLPVLAIVLYFKTEIAPPSELVAAMGSKSTIAKLLDYHRYVYIARAFWIQLVYYSGRGVSLTYLLPIYLVCMGAAIKHKPTVIQLALTLCLMLAGYSWIFLTTPYDLAFHMAGTLERLLMQLWPGFIFIYFLTALTPEESLGVKGNG